MKSLIKIAKLYNLILQAKGLIEPEEVKDGKLQKVLKELGIKLIPRGDSQEGYLGEGDFGRVYEGVYKGKRVAIKVSLYDEVGEEQKEDKNEREVYTHVKNIRSSLPPEIAKHLPEVYDVITFDKFYVIILEYLIPLDKGLESEGWHIGEAESFHNYITSKKEEQLKKSISSIFYNVLNKFGYGNQFNKIINSDEYKYSLQDDIISYIYGIRKIYLDLFLLKNSIKDEDILAIKELLITSFNNLAEEYKIERSSRFPSYSGADLTQQIELKDNKLKELYNALKWLRSNDILEWFDVAARNVMIRPSTGDLVVSDIGMFKIL